MADGATQTSSSVPLWLDCDPGHDDAFAILLAAHHPRLNLLGVSTVHGNAPLQDTTQNALSILTAIGRADVPVHPGAAKPFCREAVHAPSMHGKSGLDGTDLLPVPIVSPIDKPNAVLAMRHALLAQPKGEAWLVATGALTNVALLFAVFPEVAEHIKGLSIMGGAVGSGFTNAPLGHVKGEGERFGNITAFAEFNIYCDPEAAQAIFSDPDLAAKTTLIPLDLTHLVRATTEIQQQLLQKSAMSNSSSSAGGSTIRQLFHELLIFFAGTYEAVFGVSDGPPLHDPVAVAILLDEQNHFEDRGGERFDVEIVLEGLHSKVASESKQVGRTVVKESSHKTSGVRIPRNADLPWFWGLIGDCLSQVEDTLDP